MSPAITELTRSLADQTRPAGRYDSGLRRQSQRNGRERGCWVYLPADELVNAGIDLDGPAPLYRTWGTKRGGVLLRLYRADS